METKTYEMNGYNLHLIKTDKFREITIKIYFKRPIIKEEITIRNILFKYLTNSNKIYNTRRKISIAEANLYEPSIYNSNEQIGRVIVSSLASQILNEKYTEKGMLNKNLDFLLSFIFNPNFENEKADEKELEIVKNKLKNKLLRAKENKMTYAIQQMALKTNEDIIHYIISGYLEDLEKINSEDVYKYYKTILSEDEIDIYVIGDINFNEIKDMLEEKFIVKNKNNKYQEIIYNNEYIKDNYDTNIEDIDAVQSKLVVGYKTIGLTEYERDTVSKIYNLIIGGSMSSKLFKIVREENSLCYNIGSSFEKVMNLFYIYAGIKSDKFNQTTNLINDIFLQMINGNISEDEIENAKTAYINLLKGVNDASNNIINNDYFINLINAPDINTQIQKVAKVTKEEIIKFAEKIKIDNIYLLKGVTDE